MILFYTYGIVPGKGVRRQEITGLVHLHFDLAVFP